MVSVNLAAVAKASIYLDSDVEEPNGHLFFKPEGIKEEEIVIKNVFLTHSTSEGYLNEALEEIKKLEGVSSIESIIKVESL